MGDGFESTLKNETPNGAAPHRKREGDFEDASSPTKKSRTSDCDAEILEKTRGENPAESNVIDAENNLPSGSSNSKGVDADLSSAQNGLFAAKCSSSGFIQSDFVIEAHAAEDKGYRHSMEDAWVVVPDANFDSPGKLRCSHFAIYDGHGGRRAAEYAKRHLHANVLSAGLPRELVDVKAAKKAILEGFRKTDGSLLQESAIGGWQDGATAVCVWVLGRTVFVANVGDAKAVVARSSTSDLYQNPLDGASSLKALVLTREHKAIYPQERSRIQKAGGSVSANGRLQGRLEVSRAFGDRQFKKVGVIATPDIHSFDLTERDHFVILGCDGLWGVFGPSDAVNFVHKLLKEGLPVTAVSRRLVREAVRERCCKDNCTAIVIVFGHE